MQTNEPLDAIVLVPPYINVTTGPLLGPAMLAGAGRAAGFDVDVLDLAQRWVRVVLAPDVPRGDHRFVGDHDRDEEQLARAKARFVEHVDAVSGMPSRTNVGASSLTLPWSHERVNGTLLCLLGGAFGRWLSAEMEGCPRPRLVAVSVLYSGQVLAGLAATLIARSMWPGVTVVWGGAHITALAPEIADDSEYGRHIDGFVAGYAEQTFVDMLAEVRSKSPMPPAVFTAGSGRCPRAVENLSVVPCFDATVHGRLPAMTLPLQSSRGCAYAKCSFCTYPQIEGTLRNVPIAAVEAALREATRGARRVSFKDAFLVPERMVQLMRGAPGELEWSACTRLGLGIVREIPALASRGLRTLEIGLETLEPGAARTIRKRHDEGTLRALLRVAAESRVSLVLNYMTGIPFSERARESAELRRLEQLVDREGGGAVKIEGNAFQLERRAPIARDPRIEALGSWPWASVREWRERPTRALQVVT